MTQTVTGPHGAVVMSGDRIALGIARSLGRRGIPVCSICHSLSTTPYSRYVLRRFMWPTSPEDRGIDALVRLARDHGLERWLLLPTNDEDAAFLSRNFSLLSEVFTLAVPPWEVFRWFYDKRLTYSLAHRIGVPYPRTANPRDRAEADRWEGRFPLIVKPAIKPHRNRFTHDKAWKVSNRADLLATYDAAAAHGDVDAILLQELIPGGGKTQYSFAALCAGGLPLVHLVARRLRQYPADFGYSSTFVETVDMPEIEAASRHLLRVTNYSGLVEIEYKHDSRSGEYKLLDVNARHWSWHTLTSRTGIDFTHALWLRLQGETIPYSSAQVGSRWVCLPIDLLPAAREVRRGDLMARDYLHSLRPPIEHAVIALDDPLPALVDLPLAVVRRVLRHASFPGTRSAIRATMSESTSDGTRERGFEIGSYVVSMVPDASRIFEKARRLVRHNAKDVLGRYRAPMCAALAAYNLWWAARLALGMTEMEFQEATRDFSVPIAADYMEKVLANYKYHSDIGSMFGTTAELGPGGNAGVGLLMRGEGADHVDLIDRFAIRANVQMQADVYAELSRRHDLDRFRAGPEWDTHKIAGVSWHEGEPAEKFFRERATSHSLHYDFIGSHTVLQHLYDPLACLRSMVACLRSGGKMVHQIDLRDQKFFSRNSHDLTWLTIPTALWPWLTKYSGLPNRILVHRYREAMDELKRAGLIEYSIRVTHLVGMDDFRPAVPYQDIDPALREKAIETVEALRPKFAPEFLSVAASDLSIAGIVLVVEKTSFS